jgi:hypothetical protein
MDFDLRHILPNKLWVREASAKEASREARKKKTHRYFEIQRGQEFVIEPLKGHDDVHIMTSQRAGLKLGDYVMIKGEARVRTYQILEIDYYCGEMPDMWIAKLASLEANSNE